MNDVVDWAERSERDRASCKPIKNTVGLALGTHLAQIVHSHIPTKAAAMKRLGETASHVVLFQDQHRVTGSRQCRSAGQAADTGTDHYRVPGASVGYHAAALIWLLCCRLITGCINAFIALIAVNRGPVVSI